MFSILDKIDKAIESKKEVTLIDKMGRYFHGIVGDSWVRISGGKLRGKIVFDSKEKGAFEMDGNDILEIILPGKTL